MAATTRSPTTTRFGTSGDAEAAADRAASATRKEIEGEAKAIGVELMAAVSDSATALYEEQRNRAADEIAAIGEVLRRSVRSLDRPGGMIARYGDEAAGQLNDFAARLRRRSWGELTGDIEDFARRNPIGFIGAATGLGFIAGRFLAAAAPQLMAQRTATSGSDGPYARNDAVRATEVSAAVASSPGQLDE